MINKYIKGYLLFFLTFLALLSGCGSSPTAKTEATPISLHIPSLPNAATPHVRSSATTPPLITPTSTTAPAQLAAPTPTPAISSQRFETLPPGSTLPSDAECAAHVRRSSWEPRPDNTTANNTNVYLQGARLTGSYLEQYGYQERVTGNFTGTTDEILQWGACKWGIDEDIVRAQAQTESTWHQSFLGDCRGGTVAATNGCQSVGILQVKGADIPPTHPGTWPYAYESTAFNVDYTYAVWRACFEGKETWLGNGYAAGDVWGCVGRWFSGDWYQSSQDYIATVKTHMADKDWLQPGF